MKSLKKLAVIILGLALGVVFPRIVYADEGRLWYYSENGEACERVVFEDNESLEKQLFTLIAVLSYNKCRNLPEDLKLNFVFYDEGEVFVQFNEAYENLNEREKNLLGEQISKTACSLKGVESIMIWGKATEGTH